jgi:spore maturation protein CgeB
MGCTPFWWQLFKSLYEQEHELIVIPYLGKAVESLWWKTEENPCLKKSMLMYNISNRNKRRKLNNKNSSSSILFSDSWAKRFTKLFTIPKWKKKIKEVIKNAGPFDVCLIMNIPLNQFEEVTKYIKQETGIPVLYYDGDMPTILPQYAPEEGFRFSYYETSDLSLYDAFLVNSEGVIPDLKKMGAKNVFPFHYAVDPDFIYPVDVEKQYDIAYFAFGSQHREEWMKKMITEPSNKMKETSFVIGGKQFGIDLGNANVVGNVPIPDYKYFVGKAKLNLNITRTMHAQTYKTSTGRIFELPAMGAVMVSQPYNGLDEFFKPEKEYIQLDEADNIVEVYKELLENDDLREDISSNARQRIFKSHTYEHRAKELNSIIKQLV